MFRPPAESYWVPPPQLMHRIQHQSLWATAVFIQTVHGWRYVSCVMMKLLSISTAALHTHRHMNTSRHLATNATSFSVRGSGRGSVSLGPGSVPASPPRSHASPKESGTERLLTQSQEKLERTGVSSHSVLNIENGDTAHLCDSV